MTSPYHFPNISDNISPNNKKMDIFEINDEDQSALRAIWTSRMIWSVIVSLIAGHCLANYLRKTATARVPTHVARQYPPVICVIAVKTGFVVSWPSVH